MSDKSNELETATENLLSVNITPKLTCSYCDKQFKKQNLYDVHVLKQPCVLSVYRTNCIICNMIFKKREEYELHTLSDVHLNNIYGLTNREFKWNSSSKIQTKQAGFTISYGNETSESYEIQDDEPETQVSQDKIEEPVSIISNEIPPMPTMDDIRKKKIINHLSKIKESSDPVATFYTLLKRLTLPDYDGLYIYIAKEPYLNEQDKKFFIQIIIKFIRDLESLLKEGQTTFEGKDIKQIIINLSNKKR